MLQATASTLVPSRTPAALDRWIAGLGDREYQQTSKAHVGLGQTREQHLLTVERFPLAIILNRHQIVEASARALTMESSESFAYVLGVFRIPLRVSWSMELDAALERTLIFGTLALEFRRRRLERLARLLGVRRLLAGHAREELEGFAADIARTARHSGDLAGAGREGPTRAEADGARASMPPVPRASGRGRRRTLRHCS